MYKVLFQQRFTFVNRKQLFNSSKRFFSSFTFKNKLNLLFKSIHPDVLGKDCPEEYRDNNQKAMQEINSYLASMETGQGKTEEKLEIYFNVTKTDLKKREKTFYKKVVFRLGRMESFNPNDSNSSRITAQVNFNKTLDEVIDTMNDIKKKANQPLISKETNDDTEDNKLEYERPKVLKESKVLEDIENYNKSLILKRMLERLQEHKAKQKLLKNLDAVMNNKIDLNFLNKRSDPELNKLVEGLNSYKNVHLINKFFFPPQLIFLDESLSEDETKVAMDRLNFKNFEKEEDDFVSSKSKFAEMRKIANVMTSPNTHLRIHISRSYDFKQMPGYITIPYDFNFEEFKNYFYQNFEDILVEKKKFIEQTKVFNKLKKEFSDVFRIKNIHIVEEDMPETEETISQTDYDENQQTLNFNKKGAMTLDKLRTINLNLKQIKKVIRTKLGDKKDSKLSINCYLFSKFNALRVSKNGNKELHISKPINEEELVKNIKEAYVHS